MARRSLAEVIMGDPDGDLDDHLDDQLDGDLDGMDREALLAHARAMRRAIRAHRDCSMHDLCWHHPDMWSLLPDTPAGGVTVPDWPQFIRGCTRYRQSLDSQLAPAPRSDKEFEG